jgi:hypothetical protein
MVDLAHPSPTLPSTIVSPKRRSVGFEKGRASLPGHDSSSDPGSGSGSDYCRPARCCELGGIMVDLAHPSPTLPSTIVSPS